jgi:hypothetical protein
MPRKLLIDTASATEAPAALAERDGLIVEATLDVAGL